MTTVVGAGPTVWAPRDAATIAMVMITAVVATITVVVAIRAVVIEMMAGVAGTAGTLRLTGPRRVVAPRPLFPDGLEGTEFKGAGVLSANFQRFAGVTLCSTRSPCPMRGTRAAFCWPA